jgi:hypothetical protein
MSAIGVFEWLGHTSIGVALNRSTWGVAILEMVHLLALAALGGTILLVDLRLLGFGLKRRSPAELAAELSPIFWIGLTVILLSGVLILSTETMKCYYSEAFRIKMMLLFLALLFQFTLHNKAVKSEVAAGSLWSRSAGVLSLALWLGVGLAGRAIGYL